MTQLISKTLSEIVPILQSREISASDATNACLTQIENTEDAVHALISVQKEEALRAAEALDAAGPDSTKPLWGVPVVVKDLLSTKGTATTCASKMLEGYTPFFDAHAVAKLKEAGAIIVGKSNMDEFAMGSSTEKSAFGVTHNPWDISRVPGGSSGGSAASVSAGQCFAALGTDTGGSIRQPASFCGCVGIKPSYGRVSRYGMVAYGSSLDQIGPMARSVEDCARVLHVIAGIDKRDATCANLPVEDYVKILQDTKDLQGVRIGLPTEFWSAGIDPEVEKSCRAALNAAVARGAKLVDVSLPHSRFAIASYYILAMAEASSNLARFDGVRYGHRTESPEALLDLYVKSRSEGFGEEVQRRIMLGTYVLSSGYYDAYYRKAAQVRRLILQDYENAYKECDVICAPASPVTAWKLGEMTDDPLKMYLMDIFTISLNLAGLPGISIPVGLGESSKMPVGLQILGKSFDEAGILRVAGQIEAAVGRFGIASL